MIATVLIALLIALQIADLWTTHQALKRGGIERNPIMQVLFDAVGELTVLWLKVAGVGIAAWILRDVPLLLVVLDALYAAIVINNWRVLRRY